MAGACWQPLAAGKSKQPPGSPGVGGGTGRGAGPADTLVSEFRLPELEGINLLFQANKLCGTQETSSPGVLSQRTDR